MDKQSSGQDAGEFRRNAVEHRQEGDRFNRLLVLVGIKGWLSLAAVALLLGASIFWMLTASIPQRVNGHGILLPSSGTITVDAPCSGVISEVLAMEGDILENGDLLARIEPDTGGTSPHAVLATSRASLEAVQVRPGDSVRTGDLLFSLESDTGTNPELQAILYFAPGDGQQIAVGMSADLDPVSTDKEDFGYMLGEVSSVSSYPAASAEIARRINDEDLAREWTANGPLIQVIVTLVPDTGTVSGYRWSSLYGPAITIHAGTLCEGEVITGHRRPIELILPDITGKQHTEGP